MPLQAGDRLGPYEIVAPLGAGGMGVVYRARDPRLDREVAVKLLPDAGRGDPEARARLLSEARTVAALNHPHICTVHDVGDADGVLFVAMELVEGETLLQAIRCRKFSVDRACRLGRQLAAALEYAHTRGVVHRDFKSANVILMPDGRVKVLDFGLALRAAAPAGQASAETQAPVQRLAGTLGYMPPEVLQGAMATARSDIWALGIVLHEMVSGRLPFERPTDSDLVAAILRDAPAPMPAGTPSGVARIVERCLAKEPTDRPAHASEVALALEIAVPRTGSDDGEAGAGSRAGSMRPLAIGAAALAVLGSLAYFAIAGRPGREAAPLRFVNPTQVTTAVGVEEFAAWSPDGRTLAYSANPTGSPEHPNWDIWVVQPGGGAPINRTADHPGRDQFPSWSPDGSQIAFWSDRDGAGCYVMPALGGGPRRIATASTYDPNAPQWSSDSSKLGCVNADGEALRMNVVSIPTGQMVRQIDLDRQGEPRVAFVSWTRDERVLAFVTSTAGLSSDVNRLWVLHLSAKKAVPITDGTTKVTSPNWSPDSRTLYYVASAGASMDLWARLLSDSGVPIGPPRSVTAGVGMRNAALSADGGRIAYSQGRRVANVWRVPWIIDRPATWADATQVTTDQAYIECADLNAIGTRLAVSSDRSGSMDLWTLPAAGGEMLQLTADQNAEWCPSWSPDGSTIAFYAYRTGNREVWTIPASGGTWHQVTDNPGGVDMHPGWSSDGKELLFLSERGSWTGFFAQPLAGGDGRTLMEAAAARWSPVDRRVAYVRDESLWVAGDDGRGRPIHLSGTAGRGRPGWSPDGTEVLFRDRRADDILAVRADGKSPERRLATLSGRRGTLGWYGTPTDGKYVYFVWHEDLGDLWVMTAENR